MKVLLDRGEFVHRLLVRAGAQPRRMPCGRAPARRGRRLPRGDARAERVRRLSAVAEVVEAAPFGSDRFIDSAKSGRL